MLAPAAGAAGWGSKASALLENKRAREALRWLDHEAAPFPQAPAHMLQISEDGLHGCLEPGGDLQGSQRPIEERFGNLLATG